MLQIETTGFKKEDNTDVIVIIEVSDKGIWRIADVRYKPYRKRSYRSLDNELRETRSYPGLSYEEKQKRIEREFVAFIGKDRATEVFQEAWWKIRPSGFDIVKEILDE